MNIETTYLISFFLSFLLYIISFTCIAIPWSYWSVTLNVCTVYDCGCIFFGKEVTGSGFVGGWNGCCYWIVFLHLPGIILSIGFGFSYGREIKHLREERKRLAAIHKREELRLASSSSKEREVIVRQIVVSMAPPSYRMGILYIFFCFMGICNVLATYIIVSMGYQESCSEYKKFILKNFLNESGLVRSFIVYRGHCPVIYDLMDYYQPRADRYLPFKYQRKEKINTGLSLVFGQTALFLNITVWIYINFFTIGLFVERMRRLKRFRSPSI